MSSWNSKTGDSVLVNLIWQKAEKEGVINMTFRDQYTLQRCEPLLLLQMPQAAEGVEGVARVQCPEEDHRRLQRHVPAAGAHVQQGKSHVSPAMLGHKVYNFDKFISLH